MSKKIPEFRSAEEERAFWAEIGQAAPAGAKVSHNMGLSGLKLPEKTTNLSLPGVLMEELRIQAKLMNIPQQSLMKTYLVERIEREMRKERSG